MLNSALDAAFEYAISLCKAKEADLLEAHLKNLSGLENYKYTNEDSAMQYDYTPIPTATNTPVPSPTVSPNSGDRIVYIAPDSDAKYHYKKDCRGLKKANAIEELTIDEAQKRGYTLCGYED